MITDNLLVVSGSNTFSSGVATITGQTVTATGVSTDKIDLGTARDIGEGRDLYMVFTVITAYAGGTSVTMDVVTDDNVSLSSPTTRGSTGAIAVGSLTAGAQFVVPIPPLVASLGERYLGANYTVSGSPSAGSILAQVVEGIQDGRKYYSSGFTVV